MGEQSLSVPKPTKPSDLVSVPELLEDAVCRHQCLHGGLLDQLPSKTLQEKRRKEKETKKEC